jgi:hypothetical protein
MGAVMQVGRFAAAEEIQLLLPENQPGPEGTGKAALIVGLGVLLVALPFCGMRLFTASRPNVEVESSI